MATGPATASTSTQRTLPGLRRSPRVAGDSQAVRLDPQLSLQFSQGMQEVTDYISSLQLPLQWRPSPQPNPDIQPRARGLPRSVLRDWRCSSPPETGEGAADRWEDVAEESQNWAVVGQLGCFLPSFDWILIYPPFIASLDSQKLFILLSQIGIYRTVLP